MSKKYTFHFSDEDRFSLDDEDLVSNYASKAFETHDILKLGSLIEAIRSWSMMNNRYSHEREWFSEQGCKCQVLLVKGKGGGWQKGRFRFRLEFIPDDPEAFLKNAPGESEKTQSALDNVRSPLDDLRDQLGI
ncbi:MAG: KGK domain-containing protein [Nostoc sp.]|uniref:KGK domain-containing protein n=1 Tax=Nostoc sp. TaxID=1180 RepID=UPI002FF7C5D5